MTSAEEIEELLDQIQNQTGIRFSITDSQIDDEELLITLKNMLRAGENIADLHSGGDIEKNTRQLV